MESLLQSKLAVPRLPERRIGRERASELLHHALEARLILFSAPAGFGKTTTLVEWLKESGAACGWLSLDETDNDPVRFLSYLWAAVSNAGSDHPGEFAAAQGLAGVAVADVVAEVVTVLARSPVPVVLALDDYNVIEAPDVHRAVALLLEQLPAQTHLAIATRVDPPLQLARLRARAELVEVRAETLRFTSDEARRFLAERMGVQLSDPDLETLLAKVEGWPAALQLAGLSLAGAGNAAQFVRDFAGTHRFILDFISEEVLECLTPADNEFLLRTSVLNRLTGDLCNAVTGQTGGAETLERLERANMLIVPLDDERRWFRYHRLFADLLRARLSGLHAADLPALHARAADWHEANGFVREAIEHALQTGDQVRIRGLFHRYARDLLNAGELTTMKGWLDRLPDEIVRNDPGYSLGRAWVLVLTGETAAVPPWLEATETALAEPLRASQPINAPLPSMIESIRSMLSRVQRDMPAAVAHANRALELVPEDVPEYIHDNLIGNAYYSLAQALLAAGETDRALDAFRKGRPFLIRGGNRSALARFTSNAARMELTLGRLGSALEACDKGLVDWAARDAAEDPALAPIHLVRAEVLEQLGDVGAAEAAVTVALALAGREGDVATLHAGRDVLKRLEYRSHRRSPAGSRQGDGSSGVAPLVEPLSDRELDVLHLLAAGRSNPQIGRQLFIALGTVKAHTHSIYGKLGATNRMEAVALARELGLL
jgi:LuxR family transcriptional regulator, maltose regulon positive regulatory protein